ncbi:MAG: hypothetical protein HUU50_00210 [Candidatus Brocadiae bacterium]|nr:hypothetical protein [Candidatus Brocadiia bacterium]
MAHFLNKDAICLCPHGGQVQFFPSKNIAILGNSILTKEDFMQAKIVGCSMSVPCISIVSVVDKFSGTLIIGNEPAVTDQVQAFTNTSQMISVKYPGNTLIAIEHSIGKSTEFSRDEKTENILEITIKDREGHLLQNISYIITSQDGEEQKGKSDIHGKIYVKKAQGQYKIRFPEFEKGADREGR